MSFFSHIGLSVIDKVTGNAGVDKVGNAIKDGDVNELVKQFTSIILNGVEDKLGR